jgi:hypothetical protein
MTSMRLLALAAVIVLLTAAPGQADTIPALAARAGDTIGLPLGRQVQLSRQQVTVHLAPEAGPVITYEPGNPRIRAVVNIHPDPVSRLALEAATQRATRGHDVDWWDTTVYVDLPGDVKPGLLRATIHGPGGALSTEPLLLEVVPGVGSPHGAHVLAALERVEHVVVAFGGREVPHAIQVELAHGAGPGVARVVNPRGDLKSLVWADTGSRLRIVMTPANGQTLPHLVDFTFYLAGELPGLEVASVRAYDVDGRLLRDIVVTIH